MTDAEPATAAAASPPATDIRPNRTLWLLAAAHAANHAQAALLPLVYIAVIPEFGISVAAIAFLTAIGNLAAGLFQLAYAGLTRLFSRRTILTVGGVVFGGGMAAQGLAGNFLGFSVANVISRVGGSPQHPVGNALLSEQFPEHRRGFAISMHIAGGNVGTVVVPLLGAWAIATFGWRWAVVAFGLPAIAIALLLLVLVRESGADRTAARAYGSIRSAVGAVVRTRDLLLMFLSGAAAGGGRGLGVLNAFVPLYLTFVIGLDVTTVALMYTVFLVGSVPGPVVAGWLSDRLGRKLVFHAGNVGAALALAVLVVAGANVPVLWLGVLMLGTFSFVASPQQQAMLSDLAPAHLRDAAFSVYFTIAFGIGSLWVAVYGALIDALGDAAGLPLAFGVMAASYLVASLIVVPIHEQRNPAAAAARS
jgi:FSR family fosmidomycin resistance protein-like MFS transporter